MCFSRTFFFFFSWLMLLEFVLENYRLNAQLNCSTQIASSWFSRKTRLIYLYSKITQDLVNTRCHCTSSRWWNLFASLILQHLPDFLFFSLGPHLPAGQCEGFQAQYRRSEKFTNSPLSTHASVKTWVCLVLGILFPVLCSSSRGKRVWDKSASGWKRGGGRVQDCRRLQDPGNHYLPTSRVREQAGLGEQTHFMAVSQPASPSVHLYQEMHAADDRPRSMCAVVPVCSCYFDLPGNCLCPPTRCGRAKKRSRTGALHRSLPCPPGHRVAGSQGRCPAQGIPSCDPEPRHQAHHGHHFPCHCHRGIHTSVGWSDLGLSLQCKLDNTNSLLSLTPLPPYCPSVQIHLCTFQPVCNKGVADF